MRARIEKTASYIILLARIFRPRSPLKRARKTSVAANTTGEAPEAGPMDLDDQSCASV